MAGRVPVTVSRLAQSVLGLPSALPRLSGIRVIAAYPVPWVDAAVPAAVPEPQVPAVPAGTSGSAMSGHGSGPFAAALASLLLLSGVFLCLIGWASNFRRPPSLSYAPPVPPG
jgi:hypothetical protein